MNSRLTALWQDQNQNPRVQLVRRVMVALGLGALAYLVSSQVSDDKDALPQMIGLILSVFIGGLALVVQVLVDFEVRLVRLQAAQQAELNSFAEHLTAVEQAEAQHAVEVGAQIRDGFLKINKATELFGLVEASALRTDEVIQLVKHSTQIEPTAAPLIRAFAQAEIARMSELLKEIAAGSSITYEGEDRDWMLSLTQRTQRSIDATSLTTVDAGGNGFVDGGLWFSDLGQRYLELQREAIERKVRIRRVFVMDRPGLMQDAGFIEVCRLQAEMGIAAKILNISDIPSTKRGGLFDLILFDDVISYEVTPASRVDGAAKPIILNTRLELRPTRVRDRMARFRDLWTYARELD